MKPALTTRSGRCASTAAVSAASQPVRSGWSRRADDEARHPGPLRPGQAFDPAAVGADRDHLGGVARLRRRRPAGPAAGCRSRTPARPAGPGEAAPPGSGSPGQPMREGRSTASGPRAGPARAERPAGGPPGRERRRSPSRAAASRRAAVSTGTPPDRTDRRRAVHRTSPPSTATPAATSSGGGAHRPQPVGQLTGGRHSRPTAAPTSTGSTNANRCPRRAVGCTGIAAISGTLGNGRGDDVEHRRRRGPDREPGPEQPGHRRAHRVGQVAGRQHGRPDRAGQLARGGDQLVHLHHGGHQGGEHQRRRARRQPGQAGARRPSTRRPAASPARESSAVAGRRHAARRSCPPPRRSAPHRAAPPTARPPPRRPSAARR